MAHTELDVRERRLIEDLLAAKASIVTIAARLSRHRSTIYREIKRNRGRLPLTCPPLNPSP